MRRHDAPAEVHEREGADGARRIVFVRSGRRSYRVERLLEAWVVQGRWWAREERREYVRLLTDRGAVELYRSGKAWRLTRTLD